MQLYINGSQEIDYSQDKKGLPNNSFLSAIHEAGLATSGPEKADLFISINHSHKSYKNFTKFGNTKYQCILLRTEPESVFPAQYKKKITDKYALVITVGRKEKSQGKFYDTYFPYSKLPNPNFQMTKGVAVEDILENKNFEDLFKLDNWLKRNIIVSLIASNKVSPIYKSNYGLRRDLAKSFTQPILEIYGELWNANFFKKILHRIRVAHHAIRNGSIPNLISIYGSFFTNYRNYVGPVVDKRVITEQSKFCLVVENSNYYVSEKLFDALISGSIPIYFGPNLEDFGIPGGKITFRHEESIQKLEEKIKNISNKEITNYLKEIKIFLNSESFIEHWNEKIVYKKIIEKILLFILENEIASI